MFGNNRCFRIQILFSSPICSLGKSFLCRFLGWNLFSRLWNFLRGLLRSDFFGGCRFLSSRFLNKFLLRFISFFDNDVALWVAASAWHVWHLEALPLNILLQFLYEPNTVDDRRLDLLLIWCDQVRRDGCRVSCLEEEWRGVALNADVEDAVLCSLQLEVCNAREDVAEVDDKLVVDWTHRLEFSIKLNFKPRVS